MLQVPGRPPTFTKSSISGSLSSPLAVAESVMPSAPGATVPGRRGATSAAPGPALRAPARGASLQHGFKNPLISPCLRDRVPGDPMQRGAANRAQGTRGKAGEGMTTGPGSNKCLAGCWEVSQDPRLSAIPLPPPKPKIACGRGAGSGRAGTGWCVGWGGNPGSSGRRPTTPRTEPVQVKPPRPGGCPEGIMREGGEEDWERRGEKRGEEGRGGEEFQVFL